MQWHKNITNQMANITPSRPRQILDGVLGWLALAFIIIVSLIVFGA